MSGDFDFDAVAWTGWLVGRINEFRFCLKADLTSLASRRPHLPIYTTATVGTVLPTTFVDKIQSKHERHSIFGHFPTWWSICGMFEVISGVYQRADNGGFRPDRW
jgi:hypothetical protein